jgi:hypothetical protein
MSTIDDYERRRGPVRRFRRWPAKPKTKPEQGQGSQLALKLRGGTTAKNKAIDFDDPIPF